MKKTILLLIFFSTYIFSNINTVVSILPEKTFVEAIGGDRVKVSLMVLPGNSPHTYEPKPSQMKKIARADLYFAIGVEFEKVWLPKFKSLNQKMQVVDLTQGITKLPMQAHDHHEEHVHHGHDEMGHSGLDPHVWTSPANVRIIAKNIYDALAKADPDNQTYYQARLKEFIAKIKDTDRQIRAMFKNTPKGTKFMVFRPSWGYFAHAYGLIQLPVEVEGKSPKPRELIALIKEAKADRIKAIFTQPEFSDAAAQTMAKELKIKVIKVSPLSENWSKNLLNIARAIAGKE